MSRTSEFSRYMALITNVINSILKFFIADATVGCCPEKIRFFTSSIHGFWIMKNVNDSFLQFDNMINEHVHGVRTTICHILFSGFESNAYDLVGKARGYVSSQFGGRGFTWIRLATILSL